eukprot:756638-Pyramimonas_sp.AAC.1
MSLLPLLRLCLGWADPMQPSKLVVPLGRFPTRIFAQSAATEVSLGPWCLHSSLEDQLSGKSRNWLVALCQRESNTQNPPVCEKLPRRTGIVHSCALWVELDTPAVGFGSQCGERQPPWRGLTKPRVCRPHFVSRRPALTYAIPVSYAPLETESIIEQLIKMPIDELIASEGLTGLEPPPLPGQTSTFHTHPS